MKKITPLFLLSLVIVQFVTGQGFSDYHVLANGKIRSLTSFASLDVDNDGDIDIIAASSNDEMYFIENNGDAEYLPMKQIELTFPDINKIFAIDVDNDGFTDIVYAESYFQSNLRWIKNNGDKTFKHEYPLLEGLSYIGKIEKHDFNGDGLQDIIVDLTNDDFHLAILENDGNGGFNTVDTLVTETSVYYYQCVDVDNDNDLDIVYKKDKSIYFITNEGDFNFSQPNLMLEIEGTLSGNMCCFDSDGDGDLDLYVTISFNTNRLYLNDGNFVFSDTVFFGYWSAPVIKAFDYDNDADIDLITSGFPMVVFENKGNNNFDSVPGIPQWLYVDDMEISDIDNDGKDDIYTETDFCGMIGWLKNETDFPFSNFTSITSDLPSIRSIGVGFINNDEYPDICVNDFYYRTTFYLNDGEGNFTDTLSTARLNSSVGASYFEDINNDGFCDVLSFENPHPNGEDSIWFTYAKNLHNNTFESISVDIGRKLNGEIVFDDYDGDSKVDIIACRSIHSLDTIYFMKPKSDFTIEMVDSLIVDFDLYVSKISFYDVDGNGENDMLISCGSDYYNINTILVSYSINGKLSSSIDTIFVDETNIYGWCFADLHGNGKSDFLVALYDEMKILVIEDFANTMSPTYKIDVETRTSNFFTIDLNNDNSDEVLCYENITNNLFVMRNISESDTQFEYYNSDGVSDYFSSPTQIKYDLDLDGDLDYLSCNFNYSSLSWYENGFIHAAIDEINEHNSISISPNPISANNIEIDLGKENLEYAEVFVYNSSGSLVSTLKEINPEKTIDINITNLVPGVYFLKVKTNDGIKSSKFVVIN